jgi:hypothetical protein
VVAGVAMEKVYGSVSRQMGYLFGVVVYRQHKVVVKEVYLPSIKSIKSIKSL